MTGGGYVASSRAECHGLRFTQAEVESKLASLQRHWWSVRGIDTGNVLII